MILFTPVEAFRELIVTDQISSPENIVVFNLNSFVEGFERVRILPNNVEGMFNYTGDQLIADQILMNSIISNDDIFFEFFSKIMYPFYCGLKVILLITNEEPYSFYTESIMKIIQGRYGYNAILINEASDFSSEDLDDSMSLNGIYNFDQDKLRYSAMSAAKYGIPTDVGNLHFEEHSDTALRY